MRWPPEKLTLFPKGSNPNAPTTQIAVGVIAAGLISVLGFVFALAAYFLPEPHSIAVAAPILGPRGQFALGTAVIAAPVTLGLYRRSRLAAIVGVIGALVLRIAIARGTFHGRQGYFTGLVISGVIVGAMGVFRQHRIDRAETEGRTPRAQ
jgi:hypothetical protein